MVMGTLGGTRRTAAAVIPFLILGLSGCVSLLPQQSDTANQGFKSYDDVRVAYEHVVPGRTRVADLAQIGFDAASPNVEQLSYLGVMERFMPRSNVRFSELAPEVRSCIHARERCTAYVFRPSLVEAHRTGD